LIQLFLRAVPAGSAATEDTRAEKRWWRVDPLEAREPDRGSWVGEGEGEVDYQ